MASPLHDRDAAVRPRHLVRWFVLAGAAGAVNAMAFIASERFVTHVTGTVTRIALDTGFGTLIVEYALVVGAHLAVAAISEGPEWRAALRLAALRGGHAGGVRHRSGDRGAHRGVGRVSWLPRPGPDGCRGDAAQPGAPQRRAPS